MNNLLKTTMLMLGTSCSGFTMAADHNFYLGAGLFELGDGEHEFSCSNCRSGTSEFDATSTTFKFGFILPHGRIQIGFSDIEYEYDFRSTTDTNRGIDVDYLFVFGSDHALAPYVMAGIGFYAYEDFEVEDDDGDRRDLSGLAFNLGAGLLYAVTDNIEIEAAYQYKLINWEEIEADTYYGTLDIEMETSFTGVYMGANLRF